MTETFYDQQLYNSLLESQFWNREQIEKYQLNELKKLVAHAYENVPYYKNVLSNAGISPEDISQISDLSLIPLLDKTIIRENLNDMVSSTFQIENLNLVKTGGTTGTPFAFYRNNKEDSKRENAFIFSVWNRRTIKPYDKCVVLTGNVFKGRFSEDSYKHYKNINALWVSCPKITDEIWKNHLEVINEFQPDYLRGYPSVITSLATYIKKHNILNPIPSLKAIMFSSENLYDWQEELIKGAFKLNPLGLYGQSERVAMAAYCEFSNKYHIVLEYGIVELIDEGGNVITTPGQVGEIVATGFGNYSMPFIRYRTGDLASLSAMECECGRSHTILSSFDGRTREFIVTKENKKILFGPQVYGSLWEDYKMIKQIQFQQDVPGHLLVKIVSTGAYSDQQTTEHITNSILQRLGNQVSLTLEFVEEIPKTASGKHRFIVQNIE